MTKIVGITGGKGGTGKSTIAVALAFELAKNNKVLIVDADVDCPNDHLLMSMERKHLRDVEQRIPVFDMNKCTSCGICAQRCSTNAIVAVKGKKPIFMASQCNGCGACALSCPENAISWGKKKIGEIFEAEKGDICLISGELKTNEPVSEFVVNELNKEVDRKAEDYDYVIVDTAAGTHCLVISALGVCDIAFAVAEPTPLGKHDLEVILNLLKVMAKKAGIVLNRSDIGDKTLVKELAMRYNVKVCCEIPYSEEVVDMYAKGQPVSQHIKGQLKTMIEEIG